MTDTKKYVAEALAELELVKSEGSLVAWHDTWCNSVEYTFQLEPGEVLTLENAYMKKVAWFSGVGAG